MQELAGLQDATSGRGGFEQSGFFIFEHYLQPIMGFSSHRNDLRAGGNNPLLHALADGVSGANGCICQRFRQQLPP